MRLDQNSYMEDNREERFSPWCSYSDMFCSMLMIFILLFIFVMLQYVVAKANDTMETQNVLREQAVATEQMQSALNQAEEQLAQQSAAIASIDVLKLEKQQAQNRVAELEASIADLEQQLSALNGEKSASSQMIETYNARLSLLTEELQQAQINLGTRNDELSATQLQLKQAQSEFEQAQIQLGERGDELLATQGELKQTQIQLEERSNELSSAQSLLTQMQVETQALEQQLALSISNQEQTDRDLSQAQQQIEEYQAQVQSRDAQITVMQATLSEQETKVGSVQALYNAQSAALAAANAELEVFRSQNSESADDQIASLQQQLVEQANQLQVQESALAQVAGIRLEIIGEIRDALTGEHIEARVDSETGAIIMSSEVLFGVNEAELQQEGRIFLDTFFPVYFRVLTQGTATESVAQIIVEGHTDTTGDYLTNLDLSLRRAQSVTSYCVSLLEGEEQQKLIGMISAAGCSFSNPIYGEDGSVDMDRSRRVEVKFTLKDQYMIDEIARIIED